MSGRLLPAPRPVFVGAASVRPVLAVSLFAFACFVQAAWRWPRGAAPFLLQPRYNGVMDSARAFPTFVRWRHGHPLGVYSSNREAGRGHRLPGGALAGVFLVSSW